MTFKPGQSGNPAGYPKGHPHKVTVQLKKIIDAAPPTITRDILADAKRGDSLSRSLFARHFLPRVRINHAPVELPPIANAGDAAEAMRKLAEDVAKGTLDFEAAAAITAPLQAFVQATNVAALELRLEEALQQIQRLQGVVDGLVAAKAME